MLPQADSTHRFDGDTMHLIDGMRGIAALLVLVTHAFDLSVVDVFGWDAANSPLAWRWARASAGHGGFWVWCFFMISGLCIHQSIARSVAAGNFNWKQYAKARLTRIYPLFLLGLAMSVGVWWLREDWGTVPTVTPWRQFVASLMSLQIITTAFPGFETSWSLSCEMIYYAAWPIVLLAVAGRVTRAVSIALAGSLFTLSAIFLLWKGMHRLEHSAAVDGIWTVAVLFPVWLCGAWLAGNWQRVSEQITRRVWLTSIAMCIIAEVMLVLLKFLAYPGWSVHLASWASIPGFLVFLAGARHAKLARLPGARPVCRWLGEFSYPCYILHMQLLLIWNHLLIPHLPKSVSSHPLLDFPLLLVPVAAVLAMTAPPLERVVMKWRAQILARPRLPVQAVPAA